MSWNPIPLYLGGMQSATWQWFDMTQWQKTGRGDGNKGQGIQAAVLAAPGRSAHQLGYLLAGARVLLMERSDHSCQSSFGLRDINLPPVVKALRMQNDSGLFTCTLEFNVAQLLPLTSHFYSPGTSFIFLLPLPGPLGLHSELSLGWWTWMLNCHSNHVLVLQSFKRPSRVWRRREGQGESLQSLEAPTEAQMWKGLGF